MHIILYIWVVTAATGWSDHQTFHSWQAAGAYGSGASCHQAATNLGNPQHRCIDDRTGAVQ